MRTPDSRASRIPARWRGFTLVEIGLVVSIIGLVALSALAAYSVVVAQRHSTAVVADAAAVRAAVLKWAGGGPLAYPRISSISSGGGTNYATNPRTLQKWDQLAPHLPGHLKAQAGGDSDLTLDGINPWSGLYTITPPTSTDPMHWELFINDIPCALMEELERQLKKTNYDTSVGILKTACASGAATLTVPYEE